jgi:hypothetical protein
MPTEISSAIAERLLDQRKDAADLVAYLLLIPVALCLGTIALSIECREIQCALVQMVGE